MQKQGRGSQETIVQPWGRVLVPPQFSSVQSSRSVSNSLQPHGLHAAHQGSLSITNWRSPPKPMSTELVMPFNHLILCCPLLLLLSIFPSIRVFSSESVLRIRRPKYYQTLKGNNVKKSSASSVFILFFSSTLC